MRAIFLGILVTLFSVNSAYANEYSTEETVRFVLGCMVDLGGETDENFYTCVCRYDSIRTAMSFSDYEEGVTYERNRVMPGEKGGFFRDNARGEEFYKELKKVRENANASCPVVKKVELKRPTKN